MASQLQTTLETDGPISLTAELLLGSITLVVTDEPGTTVVLAPRGRGGEELATQFTVATNGNQVRVIAPKRETFLGFGSRGRVDVEVRLAPGSSADLRTGSGDITGSGLLESVRGMTGSGDVFFHEVTDLDVKTGSGDLGVRTVTGEGRLKSGSGDIEVGQSSGPLDLLTGSGDVEVRRADGPTKVKTGSGDLEIGTSTGDLSLLTGTGDVELRGIHGGEIQVKTGTGDILVGIAHGVATYLDLNTVTGDVDVDLDDTDGPEGSEAQARLTVHSGSGDIRVRRAEVRIR